MGLKSEIEGKVKDWRYDDLGKIERVLDHAYSSIQGVKDADSADKFADDFDELKREVKNLTDEVNNFSGKVGALKSEMEKQEE